MTIRIKNKRQLIENGLTPSSRKARSLALEGIEYALKAIEPKKLINSKLFVKNSKLQINDYTLELKKFRNVYVIGGGKASGFMAEAIEEILGEYLTNGIVNVPKGIKYRTENVKIQEASHPLPNKSGFEAYKN